MLQGKLLMTVSLFVLPRDQREGSGDATPSQAWWGVL